MTGRAETVTILFTDLVGSTELLQRAGDEQAQRIFKAHHRLLREAVESHGGHEVKWLGDGLMVALPSAADAVRCAIAMQQAARRPAAGERLEIRVGLHIGEAFRDESDYFGTPVVIARRLCDKAGAGQIYASDVVVRLLSGRREFEFQDLGPLVLKGITDAVPAAEVLYEHDPLAMLARTPFVGRAAEMAALQRAFDEARAGRGCVVVLVGEPGIGKTRTAEEFCDLARDAGAMVLWGRCYEGDWAPPFSPFAEAIRQYAGGVDDDTLRAALGKDAGTLARVVPALSERLPDLPEPASLPAEGERYRLLDAVSAFLARLSEAKPVMIVLDDLHWSDRGTAAMLRHTARELKAQRIMMLGTYRDIEVGQEHPLAAALGEVRRETTLTRISLGGLAAPEVEQFLDVIAEQAVAPDLVEAIAVETGGNPFFIREMLLHLVEEGKVVEEHGCWTSALPIAEMSIPEGVRDVIGRRLSRLSEASRGMLTVASAMAGGFTWAEMRAVAGEPESALLDALDEALGAQLLNEIGPSRYDFPHALIRHTLYDALTNPRRAALHRVIGEALDALYEGDISSHLSELAHHFYLAGDDVNKAIEYCRRAADRGMETLAFDEAALNYERAASLVASAPRVDHSLEAELFLARANAIFWAGRDDDSLPAFIEAAEAARVARRADLFARAATREFNRFGTRPEPWPTLLREALEMLPPHDSRERALVMVMLGATELSGSFLPLDRQLVEEAIEMARRLGAPEVLALTLHYRCYLLSNLDGGEELLDAANEFGSLGYFEASVALWRLIALYRIGEVEAADREVERYNQVDEVARVPQFRALGIFHTAMREHMRGNFAEGERLSAEGREVGRGWQGSENWFITQMFARLREQGRLPFIDPANQIAMGWNQVAAFALAAVSAADRGEADKAHALVEHACGVGLAGLPVDANWLICLWMLAEACTLARHVDTAPELYSILAPHETRPILSGHGTACFGSAARVLGGLATVLDRFDDAESHFKRAIEDNMRWEARPALARSRMNYAEMLLRRASTGSTLPGDREKARELLQQAVEAAREMGMAKVVADCERLLAEAG